MLASKSFRSALGGAAAILFAASGSYAGTIDLYLVEGTESVFPANQVDARAYANYGSHSVFTGNFLYDFWNVENFTNRGTMFGTPGFRIETASDTLPAKQAKVFINDVDALVDVGNYLLINAEKVENRGMLQSGAQSLVRITGDSVDLSRGDINIETYAGFGGTDQVTDTNFFPAPLILDNYWGGPTNITFDVGAGFYDFDTNLGPFVISPVHVVTNSFGIGTSQIGLPYPLYDVRRVDIDETNVVVQAIFVGYDTNLLNGQVRFSEFNTQNDFAVAGARLTMEFTNSVTGAISSQEVFVTDDMAARTNNLVILPNAGTTTSYRPSNYRVSRSLLMDFAFGGAGNAQGTTNLFYEDGVSSNITVEGIFTAYSPYVASAGALTPPAVPGATDSNLLGRLEIDAQTLDLSKVKARANTLMSIKANHVVSTGESELSAGSYRFDLASTNGTLKLDSSVTGVAKVFEGPMFFWSSLWTNFLASVGTDTNGEPVTNWVNVGYHVLMVDAYSLGITQRTSFESLKLRAENVQIDHPYYVTGELLLQATNVTMNEDVTLLGGSGNFGSSNAPSVLSLTNRGDFLISGNAVIGTDRVRPYDNLVNEGRIAADSMSLRSHFLHNKGDLVSDNVLRIESGVAKFEDGITQSDGDTILQSQDMKFHNFGVQSLGVLFLNSTNSISDSGGGANSSLSCNRGFRLLRKPMYGDLLGTRLATQVSQNAVIDHIWSATDRGVSVDGFKNNVAIGRLVLSSGQGAILRFHGPDASAKYAIYTDYLDLQGFVQTSYGRGKLADSVQIDPNVTIYYAYSNVPVEDLDGALGGRLQWVKEFSGPNSSVVVALPSGGSVTVNKGLRESIIIDSDGDGLANGYDPQPFSEPKLDVTVTGMSPLSMSISWQAAPLTRYQVEYQDNPAGEWIPLQSVNNESTSMQSMQVQDVIESPDAARYYRVRYNP